MLIFLKSKKGMSLIEVMLAALILVIIILGSSFLYVYGIGQVRLSKHYRVAAQLAAQKFEQLRAYNQYSHGDIPVGTTSEDISLGDVSYTRSTETTETVDQGLGSCKKVKVTVYWTQMGKDRQVSLVSLYVIR
jgi:prepilin-type N-terminal cleavage/methylation domain-containing protein